MGVRYMDMVMAHGHCIQIALRKLAWLSSLLIGLSDFFEACCGKVSGAETRVSVSLSVSHRRSQFFCGLFAPEPRMALGTQLTSRHSRRTTRGGPCTLKAAAATPCPCSSSGQDAPRSFGIVSFSRFQPPPEPYPFFGALHRRLRPSPRLSLRLLLSLLRLIRCLLSFRCAIILRRLSDRQPSPFPIDIPCPRFTTHQPRPRRQCADLLSQPHPPRLRANPSDSACAPPAFCDCQYRSPLCSHAVSFGSCFARSEFLCLPFGSVSPCPDH